MVPRLQLWNVWSRLGFAVVVKWTHYLNGMLSLAGTLEMVRAGHVVARLCYTHII